MFTETMIIVGRKAAVKAKMKLGAVVKHIMFAPLQRVIRVDL